MAYCPHGHETKAEDYCDICGMPVAQESPPETEVEEATCPHCGQSATATALFCESCGYDFITGALPGLDEELADPTDHIDDQSTPPEEASPPSETHTAEKGTTEDTDKETPPTDESDDSQIAEEGLDDGDEYTGPIGDAPTKQYTASPMDEVDADLEQYPPPTSPPRGSSQLTPWVAEIWVDPTWHAFQESTDPLPPLGPPRIVPLHERALIGRRSENRGVFPEVDCEPDPGCSRRQAYLTWADGHWYVNDLESANGTYVGNSSGEIPQNPIEIRTILTPDTRIYLGAWTRIVVRPGLTTDQGN
ncbi:MAG: FHA domain-containing protein [Propionibacteriaceae bacterium]|nr:FHA domain-containing protein [Propionibacteriaceae bacterium]